MRMLHRKMCRIWHLAFVVLLLGGVWGGRAVNADGTDDADLSRIECVEGYVPFLFAEGLSSPDGLAFSPSGELYVAEETAGRVSRVRPDGLTTIVVDGLSSPEGIAFDAAGNLYVVEDVQDGRLLRVAPDGQVTPLVRHLDAPEGVVWSAAGDMIYVTESNVQFASSPLNYRTRVTAVASDGTPSVLRTDSFYWSYAGITLGPDGLLYVTNEASGVGTDDSLFTVDPASGTRTRFATGLVAPEGLRFATGGDFSLYVAEEDTGAGTGRLSRVAADGSHTPLCVGFYDIEDVLVDPQGQLYVSEDTTGSIILLVPAPDDRPLGSAMTLIPSGADVRALALDDWDRDGRIDVAYGDEETLTVGRNDLGLDGTWNLTRSIGVASSALLGLASGDLNRDGKADLVSTTAEAVRLWENPGMAFEGAWIPGAVLTGTAGVTDTVTRLVDLDQDGALDIVSGAIDGTIRLWRNPLGPGEGSLAYPWQVSQVLTETGAILDMRWGDLDRDGKPDLVVLGGAPVPTLRLWRNPGAAFQRPWSERQTLLETGSLALVADKLLVLDLDGDRWLDIVVSDDTGTLYAWRNPGDVPFEGPWDTRVTVGQAYAPLNAIAGVDLTCSSLSGNGPCQGYDGARPEIIGLVAGTSGNVIVWQSGPEPFRAAWDAGWVAFGTGAGLAVALGDLDVDGDADVVTGGQGGVIARANLRPHHPMRFDQVGQSVGATGHQITALALADLDKDGRLDALTGDAFGQVTAWRNDGTPFVTGWVSQVLSAGPRPYISAIASGDLDQDGDLDVVTGRRWSEELTVLENVGTPFEGVWPRWPVGTATASMEALALADVNQDGRLDVVTGSGVGSVLTPTVDNRVTLWVGAPFTDTWQAIDVGVAYYAVQGVAVGDLDQDGRPDIVIGTNRAPPQGSADAPVPQEQWNDVFQVRAFRNAGALGWQPFDVGRDPKPRTLARQYHGFWGAHVSDIGLADLDQDGDLDIVSAGAVEGDFPVMAWENSGTPFDGTLWRGNAIALGLYWQGLRADVAAGVLQDLDRDGDVDVATVGRLENGGLTQVRVWENTGLVFSELMSETHWIQHGLGQLTGNLLTISAGDLDHDGDLDLASGAFVSVAPDAIRVWRNENGKRILFSCLPLVLKQY